MFGDSLLSFINTKYISCFGTSTLCLPEDGVAGKHLVPVDGVKAELWPLLSGFCVPHPFSFTRMCNSRIPKFLVQA